MNYKEKYERALEGIKEILDSEKDSSTSKLQSRLQDIFPELEENEDERMWKLIKKYARCNISDMVLNADNITRNQLESWLEKQGQEPKKVSIWKHWKDGIAGSGEGEDIYLIKIGNIYKLSSCLSFECDYIELSNLDNLMFEKPQHKKTEINESETNGECIGESITMKLEKAIKMKLEEAIKHCEEVALSCSKSNKECAIEHIQLMQWLKELRVLRQLVKPEYLQEIRGLQKTWGKNGKKSLTENCVMMLLDHSENLINLNKIKMEELIIGEKTKTYDGYMDEECIELCDKLNSLSSIETTESCCGHCKNPYMIFFNCYDFTRLGKLYRCVNRNYSDGKWRIECCCSDGSPIYGFLLISKEPFNSKEEMMKSVNRLIENIDYWEDPTFDDYFKNVKNGR